MGSTEPMTGSGHDPRLIFPATARNREAIAAVLSDALPSTGLVLEIASGSGEHAVAFQRRFPDLTWQASDPDPEHRASIDAWIRHSGLTERMPDALDLDVLRTPWPTVPGITAMVCINLLHISAAECTTALLRSAALLLSPGSPLIIYGPFRRNGQHTSGSNAAFDASLRQRNRSWGVRDLEDVEQQALEQGLSLRRIVAMPANNFSLLLQRDEEAEAENHESAMTQ